MSLTELLVAAVILALAMAGVANIFIAGKRYVLHSRSRMAGGEIGKAFLEPLQMQVDQSNWGTNCLGACNCSGLQVSKTIGNITYTPQYTVTPVNTLEPNGLKRVQVTVTWNENPS